MIGRHTPISRRTILRGAGASLALPWLEAMMPTVRAPQRARPSAWPSSIWPTAYAKTCGRPRARAAISPSPPPCSPWRPQGRTDHRHQSLEPVGQRQRRPLHQDRRLSHLHDGHQDSRRRPQLPRHLDGPDGGAEGREPNADPVARIGHRAGDHRRGHQRRLYPRLRFAHRLERSHQPGRQGTQSAAGLRAAVAVHQAADRIRRKTTCCCSTRSRTMPSNCARNWARPTGSGWTNISRCVRSLEERVGRAGKIRSRPTGSRARGSIPRRRPRKCPSSMPSTCA